MNFVEIIVVGKELLTGQTQDTSSHWLIQQVSSLGGRVKRIVVVDDEEETIAAEIRATLAHGAGVLFTTGGLGPTFDDRTLAGVARGTERALKLNPQAFDFVRERYAQLRRQRAVDSEEIFPAREKMAHLPQGAQMLFNPIGAAPGMWLEVEQTAIISLPGVPREMMAIFQACLVPRLAKLFGPALQLERTIRTCIKDESLLTQILAEVSQRTPGVHLKSKPTHFGSKVELEVCLTIWGKDRKQLEADIDKALEEIKRRLPSRL